MTVIRCATNYTVDNVLSEPYSSVQYKGECAGGREGVYVNFQQYHCNHQQAKFGYVKSCVECISFVSYENVSKIKTSQLLLQYKIPSGDIKRASEGGFLG